MRIRKAPCRPRGGVHPLHRKHLASFRRILDIPLPERLVVSMAQHAGAPAEPAVEKGDRVLRGRLIGKPRGFISAAVHAPTSGIVADVGTCATPAGQVAASVSIEPDGEDRSAPPLIPEGEWERLDAERLVSLVADAGIVGMGGAGFPTHVKLSPPPGRKIDTLILNGAECEPYLTADYRLMVERTGNLRRGMEVVRRILRPDSVRIATEDRGLAHALSEEFARCGELVQAVVLKRRYPQGAEKQQIFAVTGREVPSGGLPADVGVLVLNVGTVCAIWNAVGRGIPLTERVVTITGFPVGLPSNLNARIGTPFSRLIDFCGGLDDASAKVICGGPMMGLAQSSLDVTVTKTTSGLVTLSGGETSLYSSTPCISCGRCIDACPMGLMPNALSRFLEAEDYRSAAEWDVSDCIECGCCAYQCPSHRPLVQLLRRGKTEAAALARAAG